MVDDKDYTKPSIDPQYIADLIRQDRDERDAHLMSIVDEYFASKLIESIEKNKDILDKLGSDYDENGIPYWKKWKSDEQ